MKSINPFQSLPAEAQLPPAEVVRRAGRQVGIKWITLIAPIIPIETL